MVREWEELLSVFGASAHAVACTRVGFSTRPPITDPPPPPRPPTTHLGGFAPAREAAQEVLHELVDARLLTSYEVHEDSREATHRVEIIHESLLASWPRLERWLAQDTEGALLRDQLRQAARTWNEHGRPDDLLWSGTTYREFFVWRERYPGGLTDIEESFASAMTRHTRRRRRHRRLAVAATFVVLLVVLAVIGGLWRRSAAEAQRAEAANLFSLAQLRLDDHPSATVAYSIASLELADSTEVRRLVLDALWRGPTEVRLETPSPLSVDFSPDGRWLLTAALNGGALLWPSHGGPPTALDPPDTEGEGRISPAGDLVAITLADLKANGLWSFPDGRFLRSLPLGGTFNQNFWFSGDGRRLITSTEFLQGDSNEVLIRSWPVQGGEPELLARLQGTRESQWTFFGVDPTESLLAWIDGSSLRIRPLQAPTTEPGPPVALRHDRPLLMATFNHDGQQLATADASGTVKVWSLDRGPPWLSRTIAEAGIQNSWSLRFDPSGKMLAGRGEFLLDLTEPPETEPWRFRRSGWGYGLAFTPDSRWLATGSRTSVSLWPLARSYSRVFRGHESDVNSVKFTPDGRWIASSSEDGTVRLWPVDGSSGQSARILYRSKGNESPMSFAMAPDGSFVVAGMWMGQVWVLPLDGGSPRELVEFSEFASQIAVDPRSHLVAVSGSGAPERDHEVVRVWDLTSDEARVLDIDLEDHIWALEFAADGGLWVFSGKTIRLWYWESEPSGIVDEIDLSRLSEDGVACEIDPDKGTATLWRDDRIWVQNLDTHEVRELGLHPGTVASCTLRCNGRIVVTTDPEGGILVSSLTGGRPHLLPGREGGGVDVSPDGRWVVSGGAGSTIRLWPMPDLTQPPLHTVPRDELLAKLRSLTNLRAVRDETASTGWSLGVGPFPGWETAPSW